jgi:hypothetical protein
MSTIRGTVRMPDPPGQAPSDVTDSLHTHPMAHWPIADAVVYLERAPIGMWWGPPAPIWVSMRQLEHRFVPRVLVVVPGTMVRFENQDRVYHNIFSIAPTRKFDTGHVAPGETRAVRFDKRGPVGVFCELDADMAGYVFVTPNACFTRPASDGSFRLPPLPRGTYTLKVWHPTIGTTSRRVELKGKEGVTLTLQLPSGNAAAAGAR